jgi:predicted protein tyrosine phosphatase
MVRSLYRLVRDIAARNQTTELTHPPHLPLHWILPNQLAVGRLPKLGEGAALAQANIKTIVSLCAPSEGLLPDDIAQNFRCVRFILPDSQFYLGLQVNHLQTAVELIHQAIQQREPVYVHCLAGMERSPTVCIAYLCRYHQLELWEAINYVKQAHSRAMPTETQIQTVKEFLLQMQQK